MAKVITPEYLARTGTEHAEQMAFFCWAARAINFGFDVANAMDWYEKNPALLVDYKSEAVLELRWMYAIPNGGGRGMVQGTALKAEGVKAGVSDICLPVPYRGFNGLYIEMKRADGKPSDVKSEQQEFIDFVRRHGYYAEVAFGWRKATQLIQWYFGEERPSE